MTGSHAFVHFENGQNAKNNLKPTNTKNAHENEKMYNRATCLCAFRKWAKCQKRSRKREKCITGPHASVHFENGPNAKNVHENEKNV